MIYFIKQTPNGTMIYLKNQQLLTKKTPLSVIKALCISHLFTYEGYLKACKEIFHISQMIPIYLSEDIMMIALGKQRDYETIWINEAEVRSVEETSEGLTFYFSNHTILETNFSIQKYLRAKHVLKKIRNTKVKHFHLQ